MNRRSLLALAASAAGLMIAGFRRKAPLAEVEEYVSPLGTEVMRTFGLRVEDMHIVTGDDFDGELFNLREHVPPGEGVPKGFRHVYSERWHKAWMQSGPHRDIGDA